MSLDPVELVRQFRQTYVNLRHLWSAPERRPVGARLRDPARDPIDPADFPPELKRLLEQYRAEHPGASFAFYKYARSVNGQPVDAVEDDTGLPDEDHLLAVSQTVTLLAKTSATVITDLYVARVGGSDETTVRVRRKRRNG